MAPMPKHIPHMPIFSTALARTTSAALVSTKCDMELESTQQRQ